ncbi:ATP-dependent protease La [Fennellomyces sp. T-0311]|nr:ATP-dependent protease La [Fennellomyces sp. T-0311]
MHDVGIPNVVLSQLSASITNKPLATLVSLVLCLTESTFEDKLRALESTDLQHFLDEGIRVVRCHLQMQQNVEQTLDSHRREFYLRHQFHRVDNTSTPSQATDMSLSAVATPSMDDDEELADLVNHLNEANLPAYAQSVVRRDVKRLRKLTPSAPESGILRSYLELVAALPWHEKTEGAVNINVAQKHLDADHYGLGQVKRRILEYLSVIKVKKDLSPPILCLVGPPGVGKTTLARSIATALNRKFYRISLGSIRDEADIRGHRRTYIAAMPGSLINGMRKCGVKNPVILLDEIDKVIQSSHQGDPGAAMLEVLDPNQNSSFMDHFLNIPFDLSQVLFIATANSMETISGPLLDRMEVVQISGYTTDEKINIARTHLWPKQLETHGLAQTGLTISDDVLLYVAERYTQESGVRNLDRNIASLCRYKCKEYVDLTESGRKQKFKETIDLDDVHIILGLPPIMFDVVDSEEPVPGVVSGLAYSQGGIGGILPIETNQMPGRGRLTLTGSLGDILKESAYIAISWVKANAYALGLTASQKEELLKDVDLHIHVPSGAVPKDGPSAGITMVMSIISLLSDKSVPKTIAMTGEITLRGQVRAIGGVKEKVISAHRAGIECVLLPWANQRDVLQEVPENVRKSMKFVYCKSLWDGVDAVLNFNSIGSSKCPVRYTSHL